MIPVDHFGKDVSTGTRNSSGKEDAAETILALLGERSLEGKLSNPRMALRKVKGAEQGVEFPFEPREVVVGETKAGTPLKTFVIDWRSAAADQETPQQGTTSRLWPKSLLIFKRALEIRCSTAASASARASTAPRFWLSSLGRCGRSS